MSKNAKLYIIANFMFLSAFIATIFSLPQMAPQNLTVNIVLKKATMDLRGTVYPPKKTQTKQYVILASGIKVQNDDNIQQNRFCSISQDLFKFFQYGDTINVTCSHPLLHGRWIIQDCMDASMTNSIDFFISRKDLPEFATGVYNVKVEGLCQKN